MTLVGLFVLCSDTVTSGSVLFSILILLLILVAVLMVIVTAVKFRVKEWNVMWCDVMWGRRRAEWAGPAGGGTWARRSARHLLTAPHCSSLSSLLSTHLLRSSLPPLSDSSLWLLLLRPGGPVGTANRQQVPGRDGDLWPDRSVFSWVRSCMVTRCGLPTCWARWRWKDTRLRTGAATTARRSVNFTRRKPNTSQLRSLIFYRSFCNVIDCWAVRSGSRSLNSGSWN